MAEEKKNLKRIILWILIAVLAIAVIYVVFFRGAISSGSAISSTGQVVTSSGGMVGGC